MKFMAITVIMTAVVIVGGCRSDYNPTPPAYYCRPSCGCAPACTPSCNNPCAPSTSPYMTPTPTNIPRAVPYTAAPPAAGTYVPQGSATYGAPGTTGPTYTPPPGSGTYGPGTPAANPNATVPGR